MQGVRVGRHVAAWGRGGDQGRQVPGVVGVRLQDLPARPGRQHVLGGGEQRYAGGTGNGVAAAAVGGGFSCALFGEVAVLWTPDEGRRMFEKIQVKSVC